MLDLADRPALIALLKRHGLFARKGLSQHFLCSPSVAAAIRRRVEGCKGALEIGPGPGTLTAMLCDVCQQVRAIELDIRMIRILAETAPCAKIVLEDALESNLNEQMDALPRPRVLVSNMPYAITGPLLERAAWTRRSFDKAILMMQREVARRVTAPAGDSARGSLSVFLQEQFTISRVCEAPRGAFHPQPKVDSTVLELVPKTTGLTPAEEERYFRFVRACFGHPRRTLANNLAASRLGGGDAGAKLLKAGIGVNDRPHQLPDEAWRRLWAVVEEASNDAGNG
jgi:16S rRNA (adenine1518-N6/adenine1519-N6)-dimethyltransferase